MNPD